MLKCLHLPESLKLKNVQTWALVPGSGLARLHRICEAHVITTGGLSLEQIEKSGNKPFEITWDIYISNEVLG